MDIPYEECNWRSRNYTLRLVQDTLLNTKEAESTCDICSTENRNSTFSSSETTVSHLKNALNFPIPIECFFAAATPKIFKKRANKKKFYYCIKVLKVKHRKT